MVIQTQLFRRQLPKSLMREVIGSFGLKDETDNRWFSRETMKGTHTVDKMQTISKQLIEYYLPCKARNYLYIITDKICITILRQVLREFGYSLFSKETYRRKKKQILYQIFSNEQIEMVKISSRPVSPDHTLQLGESRLGAVKIDNNPDYVISFND